MFINDWLLYICKVSSRNGRQHHRNHWNLLFNDNNNISLLVFPHSQSWISIIQVQVPDKRSTYMSWWRHQMETFSALLAICAGIHRSPVNSPHKCQWSGALTFSLICAWIKGWVNNGEVGDLRHHHVHYDVTVMCSTSCLENVSIRYCGTERFSYFTILLKFWMDD